jgi:hypothetical protein
MTDWSPRSYRTRKVDNESCSLKGFVYWVHPESREGITLAMLDICEVGEMGRKLSGAAIAFSRLNMLSTSCWRQMSYTCWSCLGPVPALWWWSGNSTRSHVKPGPICGEARPRHQYRVRRTSNSQMAVCKRLSSMIHRMFGWYCTVQGVQTGMRAADSSVVMGNLYCLAKKNGVITCSIMEKI